MGHRVRTSSSVLIALLVFAGCGEGADPSDGAPATSAPASTAPAANEPDGTGAEHSGDAGIDVTLGADRLVVGGNALVYGAPDSQVRSYLGRALGDPTSSMDESCGPGPLRAHTWPALTAYVAEDGFAGWYAGDETVETELGVGVGSSRSEVEAAYPAVTMTDSSLGTEFFVPIGTDGAGISGIFDDGEVAALWSGATCVAR